MHSYPLGRNRRRELSTHARLLRCQLADGTFEIDFERLADVLLERISDGGSERAGAVYPVTARPESK